MIDPTTVAATSLASFNHISNLVKSILDARRDLTNLDQWNALQSEIASVHSSNLALCQHNLSLLAEVDNLKKEIARFEAWEAEAARYKLINIQTGVFAYALKESQADGEPPHWLCANCYNQRKKRILNKNRESHPSMKYECVDCGFTAVIHRNFKPNFAELPQLAEQIVQPD